MGAYDRENITVVVPGDVGLPSLENLVLNPRAEGGTGTVEVWRNNITNPSAETTSGTVEVMRNFVDNPAIESGPNGSTEFRRNWVRNPAMLGASPWNDLSGIGANAATTTSSVDTNIWRVGGQSVKIAATGSGQIGRKFTCAGGLLVQPGDTIRWSFWVYSTRAGSMSPYWEGGKAADNSYTGGSGGGNTTIPANTWTKVTGSYMHNRPFAANVYGCGGYNLNVEAGDVVYLDEGLVEKNVNILGDFFYGGSTDEKGWDYGWDGTANASASTAKTSHSVIFTNHVTNPEVEPNGVDTVVTNNIISNPSIETNTTGWSTADLIYGLPARQATKNWAPDPSFELGTATANAQQSDSLVRTTEEAYSGLYSLKVTTSQSSAGVQSLGSGSGLVIVPGQRYTLSVMLKGSGSSVYLQMRFGTTQGANPVTRNSETFTLTSEWTRRSYTVEAPDYSNSLSLKILTTGSAATMFYVDDVQIEPGELSDFSMGRTSFGDYSLATKGGVRTPLTGLAVGANLATTAYIIPPVDGIYSISLPTTPTPAAESGPSRRYAMAKNGSGILLEEATVNLFPNPGFALTESWTIGGGSLSTYVYTNSEFYAGSRSVKMTANGVSAPLLEAGGTGTMSVLVRGNTTYTYSYYIKAPVGRTISPRVNWRGSGGGYISAGTGTNVASTGKWQRIVYTGTAPSTAERLEPTVHITGGWAAGDVYYVSAMQVEKKGFATSFTEGGLGSGYSYDTTTNLVSNGSFESDTSGWEGLNKNILSANHSSMETDTSSWGSSTASIARVTTTSYNGTASLRMTSNAGGEIAVWSATTGYAPIVPKQIYTISAFVRSETVGRPVRMRIYFRDNSNNIVSGPIDGVATSSHPSGWTQATLTAQAPTGATQIQVNVVVGNTVTGEIHYVDAVSVMNTPTANLIQNAEMERLEGFVNSGATSEVVTGYNYLGRQSVKVTPGTGTFTGIYYRSGTDFSQLVTGDTYTFSAWVYCPTSMSINVAADALGVNQTPTIPANTWTRVSVTGTKGAGANNFFVRAPTASAPAFYVGAVQIVAGSAHRPLVPQVTYNMLDNPSFESNLNTWGSSSNATSLTRVSDQAWTGGWSMRWTAAADGMTRIRTDNAQNYVETGVTYTFSAWVRSETVARNAQACFFCWSAPGTTMAGYTPFVGQAVATTTTGWTRVEATLTIPAGTYGVSVGVMVNGALAGERFYVDSCQLELGSVATPFVDNLGPGYTLDNNESILSVNQQDVFNWTPLSAGSTKTDEAGTGARITQDASGGQTIRGRVTANIVPNGTVTTFSIYATNNGASSVSVGLDMNDFSGPSVSIPAGATRRLVYTRAYDDRGVPDTYRFVDLNQPASSDVTWFNPLWEVRPVQSTLDGVTPTRRIPWVLGGEFLETMGRNTDANAAQGSSYFNLGNRGPALPENPYGAVTTISTATNTTYTLSVNTQGAPMSLYIIGVNNGDLLATRVLPSGTLKTHKLGVQFNSGGNTSVRVLFTLEHPGMAFPKATGGGYFYLDAVQVEARDYVTPFGSGTHGGVAGYPSVRLKNALHYTAPAGISSTSVSLAGTFRLGPNPATVGFLFQATPSGSVHISIRRTTTGVDAEVNYGAGTATSSIAASAGSVVSAVATYNGTTLTLYASVNGAAVQTASVNTTQSTGNMNTIQVGQHFPNNGNLPANCVYESLMVFNTVLSSADATAIANGGTIPSTAANRSDCVFSAFVNDPPTATYTLTAGTPQRISNVERMDKNTAAELVILGPADQSLPFYVDAIQAEVGAVSTDYFDGSTSAAGDFTYSWNGTAHASHSRRIGKGVLGFTFGRGGNSGSAGHVSSVRALSGTTSYRLFKNAGYAFTYFNLSGLSPSTEYTVRASVYTSNTVINFVDRGATGSSYGPSTNTVTPNAWTEIVKVFTTGSGETTRVFSIGWENNNAPDGAEVWIDNLMVSNHTVPFFSGNTRGDGDFLYTWEGTPHDSVSRVLAPVVNYFGGSGIVPFRARKPGGGYRLGLVAVSNSTDTWVNVGPGDTGGIRSGMSAGKTYTMSGTFSLGAVSGTPHARSRRIVSFTRVGTGGYNETSTVQAATTGETRLVHVFSTPSDASEAFIRLYHGYSGHGSIVYWNNLMLTEGSYVPDYFDGSTSRTKTNLVTNPSFEVDISGWTNYFGGVTRTRDTTRAKFGSASMRCQRNASGTFGAYTQVPVVVGERYTASAWVQSDTIPTRIGYRFVAADGTQIGSGTQLEDVLPGPGWNRVSASMTIPPDTALLEVRLSGTANGPDDFFNIDGVMVERSSTLNGYYEGTQPDEFTFGWTGTPHNSQSYMHAPGITGWSTGGGSSNSTYSSMKTPVHGNRTIRALVTGARGALSARVLAQPPTVTGRTYTALATVRAPAGRRIYLEGRLDYSAKSPYTTTTGDWQTLRVTFVADSTSTRFQVVMDSGTAAGDILEVDTMMLVQGTYSGGYFDGDTAPSGDFTYGWSGTPHASDSIQFAPAVSGVVVGVSGGVHAPIYKRTVTDLPGFSKSIAHLASPISGNSYRLLLVDIAAMGNFFPGQTYTMTGWIRGIGLPGEVGYGMTLRQSSYNNPIVGSDVTVTWGPTWRKFKHTFVAGNEAASEVVGLYIALPANPTTEVTYEATGLVVARGNVDDYVDGDTPGFAWTGTPHNSTSYRPSKQLEPTIVTNLVTRLDPPEVVIEVTPNEPAWYLVTGVL